MADIVIDKDLAKRLGTRAVKILAETLTKAKGSTRIVSQLDYRLEGAAQIILTAPDYLTFIDQGRKPGKMPPIQAILEWTKIKGIRPEAAWPIAVNIAKFGIPATNVIQKSIRRFEDEFPVIIEEELASRLEEQIKSNIENGNIN